MESNLSPAVGTACKFTHIVMVNFVSASIFVPVTDPLLAKFASVALSTMLNAAPEPLGVEVVHVAVPLKVAFSAVPEPLSSTVVPVPSFNLYQTKGVCAEATLTVVIPNKTNPIAFTNRCHAIAFFMSFAFDWDSSDQRSDSHGVTAQSEP